MGSPLPFPNPNSLLGSIQSVTGNLAGGADTELNSIVLPEKTLIIQGDYVEFSFAASFAANVNNKRYRLQFVDVQNNQFDLIDTTLSAFNNVRIYGFGKIIRRATLSSYRCVGNIIGNNAFAPVLSVLDSTILGGGTFNDTTNRIRSVGNGVGANDVVEFAFNLGPFRNT